MPLFTNQTLDFHLHSKECDHDIIPFSNQDTHSNSNYSSVLIVVAALSVSWYLFHTDRCRRSLDDKTYPPALPNIGFFEYLALILSPQGPQHLLRFGRTFGYIFSIPAPKNAFIVGDPKIARTVLENSKNIKPEFMYVVFNQNCNGDTFFATNGPRANHVRKSAASAFSSQNVQRMSTVIQNILEDWITHRLEPMFVQADQPMDMDKEMMFLTVDVISQAGFDYTLTPQERTEFVNKMSFATETNIRARAHPLKRTGLGILYSDVRQARNASREMFVFAKSMLRSHQQKKNPDKHTLVYAIANDTAYESDDQRARDILFFISAGYDTTAHSIAWTMLELARNPQEQEKLRTTLKSWVDQGEQVRTCPALRNVTRESLRLQPTAAFGSLRVLADNLAVPGGLIIPKNSICMMPLYMILRNHTVFENPDSFCPGRWDDPTEESLRAFMPFVAGRRNCIGQGLAKMELTSVVGRLCLNYVVEVAEEGVAYNVILMQPKGSKLIFKRVDRSN